MCPTWVCMRITLAMQKEHFTEAKKDKLKKGIAAAAGVRESVRVKVESVQQTSSSAYTDVEVRVRVPEDHMYAYTYVCMHVCMYVYAYRSECGFPQTNSAVRGGRFEMCCLRRRPRTPCLKPLASVWTCLKPPTSMVLCREMYPLLFVRLVFSVAMQAAPSVFVTAPVLPRD